jgi:HEAT repeat protein
VGGADWLYFTIAGSLAAVACFCAYCGLFADRARGRRRCPRCWYDCSQATSLTCPECGRTVKRERALLKTRRHKGRTALALVLFLLAATAAVYPHIRRVGWPHYLPDTALLWLLPTVDTETDPLWKEYERRVSVALSAEEVKERLAEIQQVRQKENQARSAMRGSEGRLPVPSTPAWRGRDAFLRQALSQESDDLMREQIERQIRHHTLWGQFEATGILRTENRTLSEENWERYGARAVTPNLDRYSAAQRQQLADVCAHLIRKNPSQRIVEECFLTVQVLGPEGEPAAVPIAEGLHDRAFINDGIAFNTLSEMQEGAAPATPALLEGVRSGVLDLDNLIPVIRNNGEAAADAVPDLLAQLNPTTWHIPTEFPRQLFYVRALGKIGSAASDAVPVLREGLRWDEWFVRAECAEALGNIGPAAAEVVPDLLPLAASADRGRGAALEALAKIQPDSQRVQELLLDAAVDVDSDVQESAIEGLAPLPELYQQAAERLRALLQGEHNDRIIAVRGLVLLPPPHGASVAELREVVLSDPSNAVRYEAASALKAKAAEEDELAAKALDDALAAGDAAARRVIAVAGWRWEEVWKEPEGAP